MEEKLIANWMKINRIKMALKAVMNKPEVPTLEEPVMEEEFHFSQNLGIPEQSKTHAPTHVKIKPVMPADFNGDHKKG